jgi:hypothetical protein
MPRKKRNDRTEDERAVYNALLELIPGCRDVYNKAGEKNIITQVNFIGKPAFISALRDLTFGRWEKFLEEYKDVSNVLNSSAPIEDKVEACDEFFDDYTTVPQLIVGLGQKLLDISDDVNSAVEAAYIKNINTYKSMGGIETPCADMVIYLVTLGLLPPEKVTKDLDKEAYGILNLESENIGPEVAQLNDENITSRLVVLPEVSVSPKTVPKVVTAAKPTGLKGPAIDFAEQILFHCSDTIKSQDQSIEDILNHLDYDKIAGQLQQVISSVPDFRITLASLVDYIDCQTDLLPYLRSKSGPLKGVALYNSVTTFINKVFQCVADSGGSPDKFKSCLEGGVKTETAEEAAIAAESQHRSNLEYYTVEGVNDIITKTGQPPFESYSQVEQFLTYIGNLMNQFGITTKDYQKLSSICQAKKSEIEEILDKIPEEGKKQLISTLASISSLPKPAMDSAISALDKIVQIGNQVPDKEAYYSTMVTILNNVVSLSKDVNASLRRLNSFLTYLNKTEPEKRERVLLAIAENPDYVIESITRLLTPTTSPPPTTAPKPAPTQMKEEVREEREKAEIKTISTRDDLVTLIMKIKQARNLPVVQVFLPGVGGLNGYSEPFLYFVDTENPSNLESGDHYLISHRPDEIYLIDDSTEFGRNLIRQFNDIVMRIRSKYKTSIIGTNVELFYVTFSYQSQYIDKIFIFHPTDTDKFAPTALIYDKDTLSAEFYSDLFIDVNDIDDIHVLVDKSRNHVRQIIVISAQSNLVKGHIYKVTKAPNGIEFTEWGEYSSGSKTKR